MGEGDVQEYQFKEKSSAVRGGTGGQRCSVECFFTVVSRYTELSRSAQEVFCAGGIAPP